MDKLTAKDLQRRYRAGERNFAGVDLSGESLRGLNLKGIDLSEADLSRTDIRGTNFAGATLVGTQFIAAKAGTQRRWLVPKLMIAFTLATLGSFFVAAGWAVFASCWVTPIPGDYIFVPVLGAVGLVLSQVFLGVLYTRGILAALGPVAVALLFSYFAPSDTAGSVFVALVGTVAIAIAFAMAGAMAGAGAIAFAMAFAMAGAMAMAISGALTFAASWASSDESIVIAYSFAGIAASIAIDFLVTRRALEGD